MDLTVLSYNAVVLGQYKYILSACSKYPIFTGTILRKLDHVIDLYLQIYGCPTLT